MRKVAVAPVRRRIWPGLGLVALGAALAALPLAAAAGMAAGSLDTGFGKSGKVTTQHERQPRREFWQERQGEHRLSLLE